MESTMLNPTDNYTSGTKFIFTLYVDINVNEDVFSSFRNLYLNNHCDNPEYDGLNVQLMLVNKSIITCHHPEHIPGYTVVVQYRGYLVFKNPVYVHQVKQIIRESIEHTPDLQSFGEAECIIRKCLRNAPDLQSFGVSACTDKTHEHNIRNVTSAYGSPGLTPHDTKLVLGKL